MFFAKSSGTPALSGVPRVKPPEPAATNNASMASLALFAAAQTSG